MKLSFGVVAGAGALVALVVAYRRQRVDEAGAHRESTRLHTERFSQAVDKLGSDSPAVRLGGVHALAGLADDAPTQDLRQTCIDVLCAYLCLPFPADPGNLPDGTSPTEERRDAHQDKKDLYHALRKVRHTILRLIGDHYRVAQGTHRSWQGYDLDLTGVTIDGGIDLGGATWPQITSAPLVPVNVLLPAVSVIVQPWPGRLLADLAAQLVVQLGDQAVVAPVAEGGVNRSHGGKSAGRARHVVPLSTR